MESMDSSAVAELSMASIELASTVLELLHGDASATKAADDMLEEEEDVVVIRKELEMMQSFLMDIADKRRPSQMAMSRSFKTWLRQLWGLAHDVEDCLMQFYLHLESPSRAASSKQLLPRGTIAKQMRSLRNQIKQVNKSSELYCKAISSLDDAAAVPSQPNPGPTVADDSRNAPLIGQVKEKSDLIQLISQDGEQHRIISVWGMVGIDKTTLVSSVYESQEISSLFQQRAWVTISHHPFDLHGILSSLAQELDAQNVGVPAGNDTQSNFDAISAKIKTSSRSCLIVLDDVVYIEEWNLIQPHFSEDTSTNIIVITREAGCTDIYHLPDGLGNLWDLQMLDVSGTRIIKLPKTITKLKKLLYLRAGNIPNDDDASSSKLKMSSDLSKSLQKETSDAELTQGLAETVQLGTASLNNEKKSDKYHIYKFLVPSSMLGRDLHGVKTPDGISKLGVLHTLGVVNVASSKDSILEFDTLR
ncbi:hypothetical protein ABZP36_022400 [Zizania latifolia]